MQYFLDNIYIFLILIGSINILIVLYFRRLINTTLNATSKLIKVNENVDYNIEDFLIKMEDTLKSIGIEDYGYTIFFFNNILSKKEVLTNKRHIKKKIKVDEYSVELLLLPSVYQGENKEKYNIFIKILIILIKTNLLLKTKSVDKSFLNISKYHTFILHDMKNISQFFTTLQYNIDKTNTEEEKERLFNYLKSSVDFMNDKIPNVLTILEQNNAESLYEEKSIINLKTLLKKIIFLYDINIQIEGEEKIIENELLIQLVFENMIKNIVDKTQKEPKIKAKISIYKEKEEIIVTFCDSGSKIKNINKIFEPFYTTKNNGLGIGLYKVKTLLNQIDANIEVNNFISTVEFKIFFTE